MDYCGGYLSIYVAYGFLFSVIAFSFARGGGRLLINWFMINIGKVSFSAYLWHFYVIRCASSLPEILIGEGDRSTIVIWDV